MKRYRLSVFLLFFILCISTRGQEPDSSGTQAVANQAQEQWVDSVMASLTLEEQIAQLMMIRTYSNKPESYYRKMDELVAGYNLGGMCFFQGGPVMQAKLTNRYQRQAKTPLLIAMDAEWGLGMRLDSTFSFPYQMTLGAGHRDTLLYSMGAEIARQLKQLGVHMNFAPVADINNNPANPVINSRSFGENKYAVAARSAAYMRGLQDNGIIATAKHFPGHGDTDSDSHLTLPVINHSRERLDSLELYPFKALIGSGLQGVMVAHLFVPALDSTPNTPTTLSGKVVKDLLQHELGFDGLIITDALDMKGVTTHYKPGEIEVKAFLAGNDILLLPQDIKLAVEGIRDAVEQGVIPENEVSRRCRKILVQKYRSGLADYVPVETDSVYLQVNTVQNELLSRALYEQAMVVVKNDAGLLPLKRLDTLRIATLSVGTAELTPYQEMLSNYTRADHFNALKDISENQRKKLLEKLSGYNLVIAGVHNTSIFPGRNFGISETNLQLLNELADTTKLVLTLFSSPYSLRLVETDRFHTLVLGQQDNRISNEIAAQVIMGALGSSGTLPVTSSEDFQVGAGISLASLDRLKYTLPEEVGVSGEALQAIDTIVLKSIRDEAIPGCQVLVAKDGRVIYRKAFGYHTYRKGSFVKNTDLYDIASITKIASTTLSIMRLSDQRKLDIDHKLSWYLPYLGGTNKENIILRDMMAHQAGLKPWIPFYINTMHLGKPDRRYYNNKLNEEYTVKVADNLYIRSDYSFVLFDSIIYSDLRKKKDYKYSDLGFYLLKQAIENLTNKPLDKYVTEEFYAPLGMQHTLYNPLARFNKRQIVPTEEDNYFRQQLIHGYVHDPGAAMLGGVAGHAGLFSTSNDLAIFLQMLLNGGQYGGTTYIRESTVRQFTKQQFPLDENRRGIGFDKPDPIDRDDGPTCEGVSVSSFGHSGFTGTYVWADPEYNLIYVFLSNRVHPTAENKKLIKNDTRTEIHQVIYDALPKKLKDELPGNELGSLPFAR